MSQSNATLKITVTGISVNDDGVKVESMELETNVDTAYLAQAGENAKGILNSPIVKYIFEKFLVKLDKLADKLS